MSAMEDSASSAIGAASRPPPGLEDLVAEGPAVPAMPPGLVTGEADEPATERPAPPGRQTPPRQARALDGQPSRQAANQRQQDRQLQPNHQQMQSRPQQAQPPPQQPPHRQQRQNPPRQLSLEEQLQRPPQPQQQQRQQQQDQLNPSLQQQQQQHWSQQRSAANSQGSARHAMAQQQARQGAQSQVMQSKAPSMRDPGGSWGGNGPGAMPLPNPGSMLPTPAAPSSISPWAAPMHGPPPASGYQASPAANSLRNRSQQAAAASLQKFAAAEEVRRVAEAQAAKTQQPLPNRSVAEVNEQELQKRIAAQVQAEATAARITAERRGNASNESSPSKDPEVSEASSKYGVGEKRFNGRIKTFDFVQGFGFIQSPEMMAKYGCDAFLNHAVEGGIMVGGLVSFAVELNKAGKPQARRVRLEETFTPPPEVKKALEPTSAPSYMISEQYRGRVKSFNSARGFGFITCPDLPRHAFNGRDVYVSRAQAPDGQLFVGQEVDFKLVVDRTGQPQARDIEALPARRGMGVAIPVERPENTTSYNLFA